MNRRTGKDGKAGMRIAGAPGAAGTPGVIDWFRGNERRAHRRHDLCQREIVVHRVAPRGEKLKPLGRLLDLSAGGIRLRTADRKLAKVGTTIQIRLELPPFAGISPFVDHRNNRLSPKREWTGQLKVVRVRDLGDRQVEVGGAFQGLDELDRGMLALYLSTQPLAA